MSEVFAHIPFVKGIVEIMGNLRKGHIDEKKGG